MKFSIAALSLACVAAAAPAESNALPRADVTAVTDELLFSVTLEAFETRRNNNDPSTVIWTSDGCTSSPDNPLGFNYLPACHRHDFGYNNYRDQSRFTESAKLKIDNNFKTDLYHQCSSETFASICRALADVYYAAVRAFGGGDASPGKREDDLVKIYEEKLAIYNNMIAEAKEQGLIDV